MTTVGYGDIFAHRPSEMVYAIIIMFLGAQFFGYIVGSIAGLTEKSGGMQDIIQRRLLDFQDYLDEKIPAKLVASDVRQPVISAITKNYAFQLEQNSPYESEGGERVEVRILKEMPPRLRYESVLFIHQEAIQNIGIFSIDPNTKLCNSPGWFVSVVMEMLRPVFYLTGDYVLAVGEVADSLIFVIDGVAEELLMRPQTSRIECLNLYPPGSMIYDHVFSGEECVSFVRCVKALRTYHLDKHSCARIDEDDPLVASYLRERIAAAAVEQVTDPNIKADVERRTEKLNSSMQDRVELEKSTPRWAKEGGYKDLRSLPRSDTAILGPSVKKNSMYQWRRSGTDILEEEAADPHTLANPQDPEQEEMAPPVPPPGGQPPAPLDEEIAT
jgi:hypothetical protein